MKDKKNVRLITNSNYVCVVGLLKTKHVFKGQDWISPLV